MKGKTRSNEPAPVLEPAITPITPIQVQPELPESEPDLQIEQDTLSVAGTSTTPISTTQLVVPGSESETTSSVDTENNEKYCTELKVTVNSYKLHNSPHQLLDLYLGLVCAGVEAMDEGKWAGIQS